MSHRRAGAFALLGAAVLAYYYSRASLPDLTNRWDIALLCFPIIPAVLGLLYLLLPVWRAPVPALLAAFVLTGLAAIALELAEFRVAGNFAKLFCFALFGWLALSFFEELWWTVLIASVVPIADAISVFWRHGITHTITTKHFSTYLAVAVAFVVPNHSSAQVGPPDVIFFALYLAAADRFRLRVAATFGAMVALLGATIVLSAAINVDGLPALVPLSLGFLGANADVLWRRLHAPPQPPPPEPS